MMQPPTDARREANTEIEAFVRRQRKSEIITRIICGVFGLLLAAGAVALFVVVGRLGGRAWFGALAAGAAVGAPAFVLLRRAFSGVDLDRHDLQSIADSNIRVRRPY